jgi:hypothetical protein
MCHRARAVGSSLLAGLCGVLLLTSSASAATKLKKLLRPPIASEVPLGCLVGSGAAAAVYIRNTTDKTVQPNQEMRWQSSTGNQGSVKLPFPFDPGKEIHVGATAAGSTCTAWLVVPLVLQKSQ